MAPPTHDSAFGQHYLLYMLPVFLAVGFLGAVAVIGACIALWLATGVTTLSAALKGVYGHGQDGKPNSQQQLAEQNKKKAEDARVAALIERSSSLSSERDDLQKYCSLLRDDIRQAEAENVRSVRETHWLAWAVWHAERNRLGEEATEAVGEPPEDLPQFSDPVDLPSFVFGFPARSSSLEKLIAGRERAVALWLERRAFYNSTLRTVEEEGYALLERIYGLKLRLAALQKEKREKEEAEAARQQKERAEAEKARRQDAVTYTRPPGPPEVARSDIEADKPARMAELSMLVAGTVAQPPAAPLAVVSALSTENPAEVPRKRQREDNEQQTQRSQRVPGFGSLPAPKEEASPPIIYPVEMDIDPAEVCDTADPDAMDIDSVDKSYSHTIAVAAPMPVVVTGYPAEMEIDSCDNQHVTATDAMEVDATKTMVVSIDDVEMSDDDGSCARVPPAFAPAARFDDQEMADYTEKVDGGNVNSRRRECIVIDDDDDGDEDIYFIPRPPAARSCGMGLPPALQNASAVVTGSGGAGPVAAGRSVPAPAPALAILAEAASRSEPAVAPRRQPPPPMLQVVWPDQAPAAAAQPAPAVLSSTERTEPPPSNPRPAPGQVAQTRRTNTSSVFIQPKRRENKPATSHPSRAAARSRGASASPPPSPRGRGREREQARGSRGRGPSPPSPGCATTNGTTTTTSNNNSSSNSSRRAQLDRVVTWGEMDDLNREMLDAAALHLRDLPEVEADMLDDWRVTSFQCDTRVPFFRSGARGLLAARHSWKYEDACDFVDAFIADVVGDDFDLYVPGPYRDGARDEMVKVARAHGFRVSP